MKKILSTILALSILLTLFTYTGQAVANPVFSSIESFDGATVNSYAVLNSTAGSALSLTVDTAAPGPVSSATGATTSSKDLKATIVEDGTDDSFQEFYVVNPYIGIAQSTQPDEVEFYVDTRYMNGFGFFVRFIRPDGYSYKLPNAASSFTAYKKAIPGGTYTAVTCGYSQIWLDNFKGFVKFNIADFKHEITSTSLSDISQVTAIVFGVSTNQVENNDYFYLDSINFMGALALNSTFTEKSITNRIADRDGVSVFQAWSPADNIPEDVVSVATRHDLLVETTGYYGLDWEGTYDGFSTSFTPISIANAKNLRRQLLTKNPNMILFASINYYSQLDGYIPSESDWWRRDQYGQRIIANAEYNAYYLDWSNSNLKDNIVAKCVAVIESGVVDGIMFDWWSLDPIVGYADDDADRIDILQRVRNAIGTYKLIIVNSNHITLPNSAQYINGSFMECGSLATASDWNTVVNTLTWAETNYQEPQINCTETWIDTSRNELDRMRATTTLAMIHGDGYALFSDNNELPVPDHLHDWYSFWDAPIGTPGTQWNANGVFYREYSNGKVVYNPQGNGSKVVTFGNVKKRVSTGECGSSFTINERDGDIFLNVAGADNELLANSNFENGYNNWTDYCAGTIASTSNPKNLGNYSLYKTARPTNWSGIQQSITTVLYNNGKGNYTFEGYLRAETETVNLAVKICIVSSEGGTVRYSTTAANVGTTFTKQSSTQYLTWSGTLTNAYIYVEGNSGGGTGNFYADDLSLKKVVLLNNPSFEDGLTGWTSYNSCTLTAVNWPANTGSKAIKITDRNNNKNTGVKKDIISILDANGTGTYTFGTMLKTTSTSGNYYLTIRIKINGVNSWFVSSSVACNNLGYTNISTSKNILWSSTIQEAYLYVESTADTNDYYVDDFKLQKT